MSLTDLRMRCVMMASSALSLQSYGRFAARPLIPSCPWRRAPRSNADPKPRPQERAGHVRTDETGASGNQCVAHHGSDRLFPFQRAKVEVALRAPQIRVVDLLPVV